MAKQESIFYGESRAYAFPLMDLNGQLPNALNIQTPSAVPMQLSQDGDWGFYGMSAMYAIPAAGGVASNTLVNLQVVDQNTSENMMRQSNQNTQFGAPAEHVCGKAGFPNYFSWPRVLKAGSRLYPYIGWVAPVGTAAPTGRSPWYVVAHCKLLRPGMAAAVPIGSRDLQLKQYGGLWTTYTGVFNLSAADPLLPNQTRTLQVPIAGKRFFFVDSIWARVANAQIGPVNAENVLTAEDEILVSMRDTQSLSTWSLPGFVPLWTMAGSRGGFPFCPPSPYVVRPNGSIELNIKNGPTANVQTRIEVTFGGVVIDLPEEVVRQASLLQTQGSSVILGG